MLWFRCDFSAVFIAHMYSTDSGLLHLWNSMSKCHRFRGNSTCTKIPPTPICIRRFISFETLYCYNIACVLVILFKNLKFYFPTCPFHSCFMVNYLPVSDWGMYKLFWAISKFHLTRTLCIDSWAKSFVLSASLAMDNSSSKGKAILRMTLMVECNWNKFSVFYFIKFQTRPKISKLNYIIAFESNNCIRIPGLCMPHHIITKEWNVSEMFN